jgi:hypothetical protein
VRKTLGFEILAKQGFIAAIEAEAISAQVDLYLAAQLLVEPKMLAATSSDS